MIPALKRVSTKTIKIKPGTASNKDLAVLAGKVIHALQIIPPRTILMDLVKDHDCRGWDLTPENSLAMLRDIPVKIAGSRNFFGKGRLPDLARPTEKNHLPGKISLNLSG
jgi:hypothetical protein